MKTILNLICVALLAIGCGTNHNSDHSPNENDGYKREKKGSEKERSEASSSHDNGNKDERAQALSEVSLGGLEGHWDQSCYGAGLYFSILGAQYLSGAKRVTKTVEFERDRFRIQIVGFSTENCTSESRTVKVLLSGQFKLTGPNLWNVGGSKIDSTIQTAEVTPLSKNAAEGLNEFRWGGTKGYKGFCKFQKWSDSLTIDVFGQECDYLDKSDYVPFSIIKIQESKMYFGFADMEHDGARVEKRPVEWSHYYLSKHN